VPLRATGLLFAAAWDFLRGIAGPAQQPAGECLEKVAGRCRRIKCQIPNRPRRLQLKVHHRPCGLVIVAGASECESSKCMWADDIDVCLLFQR
jgi:hypothetical protein